MQDNLFKQKQIFGLWCSHQTTEQMKLQMVVPGMSFMLMDFKIMRRVRTVGGRQMKKLEVNESEL